MKLFRFGPFDDERPGVVDADGVHRDASSLVDDWAGENLSDAVFDRVRREDLTALPAIEGNPRFGIPAAGGRNAVGIGLNYADHAAETGADVPEEPIVFLKSAVSMCGPDDDLILPPESRKTDWEAELAVIIGTRARYVSESDALSYVAGYANAIDFSERHWQAERGPSWDKGKGFETFGPVGPYLVTRDEVPDPQALDIRLEVDGEVMQRGNTSTMIFSVVQLVSYVSQCIPLQPGDVIYSGTPPGVGFARSPQVFIRPGQRIRMEITGFGAQEHLSRQWE